MIRNHLACMILIVLGTTGEAARYSCELFLYTCYRCYYQWELFTGAPTSFFTGFLFLAIGKHRFQYVPLKALKLLHIYANSTQYSSIIQSIPWFRDDVQVEITSTTNCYRIAAAIWCALSMFQFCLPLGWHAANPVVLPTMAKCHKHWTSPGLHYVHVRAVRLRLA